MAYHTAILYSNRAACYLKTGECTSAISDCTTALSLSPHNTKALLRRASAYEMKEKYMDAYVDYRHVINVDSTAEIAFEGATRWVFVNPRVLLLGSSASWTIWGLWLVGFLPLGVIFSFNSRDESHSWLANRTCLWSVFTSCHFLPLILWIFRINKTGAQSWNFALSLTETLDWSPETNYCLTPFRSVIIWDSAFLHSSFYAIFHINRCRGYLNNNMGASWRTKVPKIPSCTNLPKYVILGTTPVQQPGTYRSVVR